MEDGKPVRRSVDVHPCNGDLRGAQGGGNVHQQVGPVLTDHLQGGGVGLPDVVAPGDLDPAALVGAGAAVLGGVGAVPAVDAHPVAPGDEPHDLVPRHRGAALCYDCTKTYCFLVWD